MDKLRELLITKLNKHALNWEYHYLGAEGITSVAVKVKKGNDKYSAMLINSKSKGITAKIARVMLVEEDVSLESVL